MHSNFRESMHDRIYQRPNNRHKINRKPEVVEKPKKYNCAHCNKVFDTASPTYCIADMSFFCSVKCCRDILGQGGAG